MIARHRAFELGTQVLVHATIAQVVHRLVANAVLCRHHVLRVGGKAEFHASATHEHVLLRTRVHEIAKGHLENWKARKRTVRSMIRPVLRRELRREPAVESFAANDGHGFAGPRAVRQAVERVLHLLVRREFARFVMAGQHGFRNHQRRCRVRARTQYGKRAKHCCGNKSRHCVPQTSPLTAVIASSRPASTLVVKRCPSEMRSISMAMASMDCSMRCNWSCVPSLSWPFS